MPRFVRLPPLRLPRVRDLLAELGRRPRPLRPLNQADLSNEVVHLTGRLGPPNNEVDDAILQMSARERLLHILERRSIRAHRPFHGYWGDPVVCFTEATYEGLQKLVPSRYPSYGLGFSKNWLFQNGGGPAFYVRGDDWDEFCQAEGLTSRVKAFGTKYWPGLEDEAGLMADSVRRQNEWVHEREWRTPMPEDAPELRFALSDVSILLLRSLDEVAQIRAQLGPDGAQLAPKVFLLDGHPTLAFAPGIL
jgi:hypothetical protein